MRNRKERIRFYLSNVTINWPVTTANITLIAITALLQGLWVKYYNTLYIISLYIVQCALYPLYNTFYNMHYILYTIHCTLYSFYSILFNVHCTLYPFYSTLCIMSLLVLSKSLTSIINIIIFQCDFLIPKNICKSYL